MRNGREGLGIGGSGGVRVWGCGGVGVGVWICPARLPVIVLVAGVCYTRVHYPNPVK